MNSLTEFFRKHHAENFPDDIAHKDILLKRSIVAYIFIYGESTLTAITKSLHISVPTATKYIQELVNEGIVFDAGKVETVSGRRPNTFGLTNTALYFAGVNIARDHMNMMIIDLQNNIVKETTDNTFVLEDTPQCGIRICNEIDSFLASSGIDRTKILGCGVCITGRVNSATGYSMDYFTNSEDSMRDIITKRIGMRCWLESDIRARCFAEYTLRKNANEKNLIYLHVGYRIAIGIIADGRLYYGKSGFAGEFGHVPMFDNGVMCRCGKVGCLETEASGRALERQCLEALEAGEKSSLMDKHKRGQQIHLSDIVTAAKEGDALSRRLIANGAGKVGRAVSFLLDMFNPEAIVMGGIITTAVDAVTAPMRAEIENHTLDMVWKETRLRMSKLDDGANALGVAMLLRNRILSQRFY